MEEVNLVGGELRRREENLGGGGELQGGGRKNLGGGGEFRWGRT